MTRQGAESERRDAGPPRSFCPKCAQRAGVEILYDYPGRDALEAAGRGEIALGTCCVNGNDPDPHCSACGHTWRSEARRTATGNVPPQS